MHFANCLISTYGVAPEKVHVIPGAVDTSRFQPAERASARASSGGRREERIIFCLRRLVERMGLEALIAAFARSQRNIPTRGSISEAKVPCKELWRPKSAHSG